MTAHVVARIHDRRKNLIELTTEGRDVRSLLHTSTDTAPLRVYGPFR
jgi:hypothetical protein